MPIKNGKTLRVPANYKGMLKEIDEVLTACLEDDTEEEKRQKKLVKDKANFKEIRKYFVEMSAQDNHFNKEGLADSTYILKPFGTSKTKWPTVLLLRSCFIFEDDKT